jgi:hypothetical protein
MAEGAAPRRCTTASGGGLFLSPQGEEVNRKSLPLNISILQDQLAEVHEMPAAHILVGGPGRSLAQCEGHHAGSARKAIGYIAKTAGAALGSRADVPGQRVSPGWMARGRHAGRDSSGLPGGRNSTDGARGLVGGRDSERETG